MAEHFATMKLDTEVTIHQSKKGIAALLVGYITIMVMLVLTTCCVVSNLQRVPRAADQMTRAVELRVTCVKTGTVIAAKYEHDIAFEASKAGSGVIVGQRRILTARHVVNCEDEKLTPIIHAKLSEEWVPVSIARLYTPTRDIAALYLDRDTGFDTIAFRAHVREGESVCAAFAFPKPHYDCGMFKGYVEGQHNGALGIPAVSGNSGSGLFDRQGNLVGLVTAQRLCNATVIVTVIPVPAIAEDGTLTFEPLVFAEPTFVGGPECDSYADMLGTDVQP